MRIILAPMEGLADFWLRQLITEFGGIDLVINEFVRVVDSPLPDKVFYKNSPELLNNAQTRSGTPIRVQLLGSHPQAMADTALTAIRLGSNGIDLNFGCPSKTVNNHCGGAAMLKNPDNIYAVVHAVRQAVPKHIPVSAKMRLGFDDTSLTLTNAEAICAAGASELTVHGRTRKQGYKPPAYWEWIAKINEHIHIPVIANGEVWSTEDYHLCRQQSGCSDVMLGRGIVCQPDLAAQIKHQHAAKPWQEIKPSLIEFYQGTAASMHDNYVAGRVKQWVKHLTLAYPEADALFNQIRAIKSSAQVLNFIEGS